MKKLISILIIFSIISVAVPFSSFADDSLYEEDVYYHVDFDEGGSASFWTGGKVADDTLPHRSYGRLIDDSDSVRKAVSGVTKFGPDETGSAKAEKFLYSFDAKWVGNLPQSKSQLFEINYYKPNGSDDWYHPMYINADGTVTDASGNTVDSLTLSLDKWYNFSFEMTFSQNENYTLYTDITVTDEETGEEYIIARDLGRNNVVSLMNKLAIFRKGMGSASGAYLYVDNIKFSRLYIPAPEFTFEWLGETTEVLPAGEKVRFKYTAKHCQGIFNDGGGVQLFRNGEPIGDILTEEEGVIDVTINEGQNDITAKLVDSYFESVMSGAQYCVKGISLTPNADTPGFKSDFDTDTRGAFNDSATKKEYGADSPDDDWNNGKIAHGQWPASHTGNVSYSSGRPFTVSGTVNIKQGRYFEVSADIKSNCPTDSKTLNLLSFTFNKTNPIVDLSAEGWGTGMCVISTGEITCYGTSYNTGIYADLENWHNYKIIYDTNPGGTPIGYYFIDDILIHVRTNASSNIRALQGLDIVLACDGENVTDMYLDNVTLKTYDQAFDAYLDIDDVDINEVPYENISPKITFSLDMDEDTFDNMILKTKGGAEIEFSGTYNSSDKTYTFSSLNLLPNTEYVIDLTQVRTVDGAGGKDVLTFKTQKAPFSIRGARENSTGIVVTLNNRNSEEKSAILIAGYYDADTLHSVGAREVTSTRNGETQSFTLSKPDEDVWVEVYLLDSVTYEVIDKLILS